MIAENSVAPVLGAIFHPSYMMINTKILGSMKHDEEACKDPVKATTVECMTGTEFQASFGVASSTVAILLLATSLCFVLGLGNLIP